MMEVNHLQLNFNTRFVILRNKSNDKELNYLRMNYRFEKKTFPVK